MTHHMFNHPLPISSQYHATTLVFSTLYHNYLSPHHSSSMVLGSPKGSMKVSAIKVWKHEWTKGRFVCLILHSAWTQNVPRTESGSTLLSTTCLKWPLLKSQDQLQGKLLSTLKIKRWLWVFDMWSNHSEKACSLSSSLIEYTFTEHLPSSGHC